MADVDPLEGADNPVSDRPEWLPENFKAPEDLVASYKESQRKITELATQNKGLEDSIGQLSSQFDEFMAAQNQPDPADVEAQWLSAYEQNPIATMQQLAQLSAQQAVEQYKQQNQPATSPDITAFMVEQNLRAKYPDWNEYRQEAASLLDSSPVFNNEQLWANPALATQAAETAYQMVKAQKVLAGNAVVEQQMADTRQMKLGAQSATGAGGRPESPDDAAQRWQEIMNAPATKLDFS